MFGVCWDLQHVRLEADMTDFLFSPLLLLEMLPFCGFRVPRLCESRAGEGVALLN